MYLNISKLLKIGFKCILISMITYLKHALMYLDINDYSLKTSFNASTYEW